MKRLVALALSGFAVVLSVAPSAAGDPTGVCPDDHAPFYDPGNRQDKNGNGFVCLKFRDGRFTGGPDDGIDDIVV